MDLKAVFRLRARIARVERLAPGEGVSFGHRYRAERPTWVATVPIGHTDGYPADAAGNTRSGESGSADGGPRVVYFDGVYL